MDAQTFLDNFATVAEAPGGVQRLRDLVLGLAVTGQLVPHDTNAGAANRLISDAADLRADLVKRGLVPKPRAFTANDDPPPFTLPSTWAWTNLDSISVYIQRGKSPKYASAQTSTPVVSQKCVQWSGFDLGPARYVVEDSLSGYGPERFLQPGDLLWNSTGTGTVGRVIAVPDGLPVDRVVADSHVTVIRLANSHPQFVRAWLASTFVQSRIEELTSGTTQQQELNTSTVRGLGVPVPPRPEQERIVAKLDELMRLCDDLEARRERRHRATTRFRSSALHALTEAETPSDLHHAWERVNANWPAVTTNAEDVRSLQATVLQLAVEGRLVSRLPQEGTADQALSAVNDERARLVCEGAIARPKASVAVTADEEPYELPEHWRWVHVEDVVTHIVDCLHRTPPYAATGIPAIRTSDVEPGRVLLSKALLVDEATYREQTRRLIPQQGDVLYSREGGRFGIAAVVPPDTKLCLSQRMMQFRCAAAVSPDYFSWFLNSPLGFGQAAEDVGGSASPHVNIKSIRRFVMPLPPTGEQLRIVEAISRMLGAIDHLASSLDRQEERASRLADAASALVTG